MIKFDVIYQFSRNGALTWLIIIIVLSVLGSLLPAIHAKPKAIYQNFSVNRLF